MVVDSGKNLGISKLEILSQGWDAVIRFGGKQLLAGLISAHLFRVSDNIFKVVYLVMHLLVHLLASAIAIFVVWRLTSRA